MERKVNIITDFKTGKEKLCIIQDILFKGRQNIEWAEVEKYIKRYIGEFIENTESGDIIYIGADLPDEYAGSKDTAKLIVRHSSDQKLYLYDIINTKKETGTPL